MTKSVLEILASPNHPIWRILAISCIMLGCYAFFKATAQNFDADEIEKLGVVLVSLVAREGLGAWFTNRANPT